MITYRVYKGDSSSIAADLALKNRLYVSGWMLSGELKRIREFKDQSICLGWKDGTPISVMILSDAGNVQAFVRKTERRQGIGSAMVKEMRKKLGKKRMYAKRGIQGSYYFWSKNGADI